MSLLDVHLLILLLTFFITSIGCVYILRDSVFHYGIVLIISLFVTVSLCLFFYCLGFYRFTLPVPYVLPVVAVSFSFLALFLVRYRPKRRTFPFFFMTLTFIFTLEVLLKEYAGIINFKNGWDYWDSYSLYWVFSRLFDWIGEGVVPAKHRSPIRSETAGYWSLFLLSAIYFAIGVFILRF
ncbi:hypothetical protein [Mesobacillus foraminis]|uniref:Uncharacterized protein n=2 Tax=Mesobacillus foraminis TaxID=279826 RepID=A0A4R2BIX7_9BACI|nr:hypothetical protein [Mesobacillus foraminis]TCN27071.1 hypothetical protein EV146_10211 [Mesobacillus foraminis]